MSKQLLTRCPHCSTLFKLYSHQIEAAGGFVRCGSCMKVFKAHKNILNEDTLPNAAAQISTSQLTPSAKRAEPIKKAHAPASKNPTHRPADKPSWTEALTQDIEKMYQQLQDDLAGNPKLPDTSKAPTPKHTLKDSQDWAQSLLDQLEGEIGLAKNKPLHQSSQATEPTHHKFVNPDTQASPQSSPVVSLQNNSSKPSPSFEGELSADMISLPSSDPNTFANLPTKQDETVTETDDAWAEQLLSEIGDSTQEDLLKNLATTADARTTSKAGQSEPELDNMALETQHQKPFSLENASINNTAHLPQKLSHSSVSLTQNLDQSDLFFDVRQAGGSNGPKLLPHLETMMPGQNQLNPLPLARRHPNTSNAQAQEAHTLDLDENHDSKTASVLYAIGGILCLLLTLLEYIYLNFDNLAQPVHFRGILSSTCSIVGCTLPPQQDHDKVVREKLEIVEFKPGGDYSHLNKALRVYITIRNEAAFEQPFPDLQLRFKDIDSRLLAERRFQSTDYLGKDFPSDLLMPTGQPVQITFDIAHPGHRAVNYDLTILPKSTRS